MIATLEQVQLEKAERCKKSFAYFLKQCWHVIEPAKPLIWGMHTEASCEHLQAIGDGQLHRLVANIAPGFGKSSMYSVAFPAWIWTRKPYERFLCASYALDLAIRDNRNCRMLIESEWYQSLFSDVFKMAGDQNVKSYFENDKRGYRLATAVRSSGTGKRGTGLIIDDPNNGMAGVAEIEAVREWFGRTWMSRLNDQEKGFMIVVGQRLSDKDLTSHILRLDGWECMILPTEYEPSRKSFTSIGWSDKRTQEGELLCSNLLNKQGIETLKRSLGSINYAAQYQQSPVPADGGTFKERWIRYFEEVDNAYILHTPNGDRSVLKSDCWRFTVVDLAISLKQTADYTVIQTYDVTPQNDLLLIDQIRDRMDNPTQQRTIRLVYATLKPRFVKIETVGYQLAILQELRDTPTEPTDFVVTAASPEALDNTIRQLGWANAYLVKNKLDIYEMVQGKYYVARVLGDKEYFKFAVEKQGYCKIIDQAELNKFSIPLKEYRPSKDKVTRASTPAIQMENGKMYFRQGAHYLTDLVTEILMFPKGANDDQIDGLSMGADEIVYPQGIIAWSIDDSTPTRTLEMAELPENNLRTMMEIEKLGVEDDEGEYYTYGSDY